MTEEPANTQNDNVASKEQNKFFQTFKSLISKPISLIPAVIVGIVIGLAPIWYNNYLNSPELIGRIITMSTGTQSSDDKYYANHTVYTVFLIISNKRNTPVSVVDYELEMTFANNTDTIYFPTYADYQLTNLTCNIGTLTLYNKDDYLLNNTTTPITPDKPLLGYIYFDGHQSGLYAYKRARIILIDVFGSRYTIDTPIDEFRPPQLLPFIFKNVKFENPK